MTEGLLYGWKDIARFIGCSSKTAYRYYKHQRMPIRFLGIKPVAEREKILDWYRKHKTRAR